jgi:hypothetical protein
MNIATTTTSNRGPAKSSACQAAEAAMPDLLFDPAAAPASARLHLADCVPCQQEFHSLRGTMRLLEGWGAPEPSPFWDARMGARLREEQEQPQRGWRHWPARVRAHLLLSNYSLKPVASIAVLGLLIAAGGGTWLDLSSQGTSHPISPAAQASNTVRDLQSLNENAQVFQQLSAIDGPDSGAQGSD